MFLKILLIFLLITRASSNDYKRGEKLYNIMCDGDAIEYKTKEELSSKIEDYCKNLNEKNLQAVVFYLIQKKSKLKTIQKPLIPKDARCKVCGMFVAKYPKWTTTIKEVDGKILYFDGVKDMMKYYFDNREKFNQILVNDYYTLTPIIAQDAIFVIGSNIYGPMGDELIAFKTKKDAKNFLNEHHGKKIVKFDKITKELVYNLDK